MSNRNEDRDIYYVPPNFLTSGRLFGGAIRIRNAIEAGVLVLLTGIPIIRLPISLTARIMILCLITLPLGIFGVIGIEGDALSEFLICWVKWLKNRRVLKRSDTSHLSEEPATAEPVPVKKSTQTKSKKRKKHKKINKKKPIRKVRSPKAKASSKGKERFTEDLIPVKDMRKGVIPDVDLHFHSCKVFCPEFSANFLSKLEKHPVHLFTIY